MSQTTSKDMEGAINAFMNEWNDPKNELPAENLSLEWLQGLKKSTAHLKLALQTSLASESDSRSGSDGLLTSLANGTFQRRRNGSPEATRRVARRQVPRGDLYERVHDMGDRIAASLEDLDDQPSKTKRSQLADQLTTLEIDLEDFISLKAIHEERQTFYEECRKLGEVIKRLTSEEPDLDKRWEERGQELVDQLAVTHRSLPSQGVREASSRAAEDVTDLWNRAPISQGS